MVDIENIERSLTDAEKQQIKIKLLESLEQYKKKMAFLYCDGPIGMLCLPKSLEKKLLAVGITRVFGLLDRDLIEIKSLSDAELLRLTTSLHEFISVS